MKRFYICAALAASLFTTSVNATPVGPDEKDYDESVRLPIRRLHPERDFDKIMKQMHKEHKEQEAVEAASESKKDSKKKEKEAEKERKRAEKEAKKAAKNGHDNRVIPPRPQHQQSANVDKSLMQTLLSKDYSIKKYDLYEEPKPITWKDDPISQDISGLMTSVDGRSKGGVMLYAPKGMTMSQEANEVFFCFESSNGRASSRLHLRVYYFADDPLNFNDIVFTIDGFNYNFHPSSPSRGKKGARMFWEQSEDALTAQHKDLVYALSHCHWARMSLKGADGMDHVKMLTKAQLEAFASTFELYRAMGGTF